MKLDQGKTKKQKKGEKAAKQLNEKKGLGKRRTWIEYKPNDLAEKDLRSPVHSIKGSDGIPGKVCKSLRSL